jgi:hypothetical protein
MHHFARESCLTFAIERRSNKRKTADTKSTHSQPSNFWRAQQMALIAVYSRENLP